MLVAGDFGPVASSHAAVLPRIAVARRPAHGNASDETMGQRPFPQLLLDYDMIVCHMIM